MSKQSNKVKQWRLDTKKRLIDGFGGKCNKCGYSKCISSLDFHHINPLEKDFQLSNALSNPKKWNLLVEEAKKCILLCRNCHGELHAGDWSILDINIIYFQGEKTVYQKDISTGNCVVCGKEVFFTRITCSRECAGKRARKIVRPSKEELKKMLWEIPASKIADQLGVSDISISKWAKSYGLSKPPRGYWGANR